MERAFGTISQVVSNLETNVSVDKALVFAAWKEAAGPGLGDRTFPCEYSESRLKVVVEDITWKHQLEGLAPTLLARLNSRLDRVRVKYIEFCIDEKDLK